MLNRSSIFSFETLRVSIRPLGAVFIALAVCVVARIVIGVVAHHGLAWPASLPAKTDSMRESRYQVYGPKSPSILLMGTSRLVDVSAQCLAKELLLRRDAVSNFSHLGNSPWRNLALVRRNPELVASARVAYMDVSPFQFNNEDICLDEQFLRHASFAERMTIDTPSKRAVALADLVVPIWSERRTVAEWWNAISFMTMPAQMRSDVLIREVDDVKRLLWTQIGVNSPEAMAENIASTGPITELNKMAISQLIDSFPADCTIVLVHIPTFGEMGALMFGTPERRAAWEALRAYLNQIAAENRPQKVVVLWPESPAEMGLSASDFLADNTHFNDIGSTTLCRIIAGHILEHSNLTL